MEDKNEQATQDWHKRAIVRFKESVKCRSVDPYREHTFRAGEEVEMVQWGYAGRPFKDAAWWTSYDIDGALIVKSDKVEVIKVLDEVPPIKEEKA